MKIITLTVISLFTAGLLSAQAEPKIRDGERFTYVSLEGRGSYSQLPEKLNLLMQEVAKQKIMESGTPLGIFHNAPGQVKEEELLWEVAVSVDGNPAIQPPLVKKEFAYAKQVEMVFKGPYANTGEAYQKLFAFIGQRGYTPCGPVFETWMDDPSQVKPQDCRTLIVLPVVKN